MNRHPGKIRAPKKAIGGRRAVGHLTEEQEFEACWNMIYEALTDIHRRDAGKLSFEQLYRASYKIVLRRRGTELYEKVGQFEKEWFEAHVIPPIFDLVSGNLVGLALGDLPGTSANERREMGEKFLKGMRDSWERHTSAMGMITDILMYLDRGHSQDPSKPPLYMTVMGLYRDNILRREFETIEGPLTNVINAVVLDLVNMERRGDIIDRNLVKRVLLMYEQLAESDELADDERLYLTTFEPAYVDSTARFYALEASRLVAEGDASVWLRQADRRLKEEIDRCETTVSKLSQPKIVGAVEDELVARHLDKFLGMESTGIRSMIDNDSFSDLSIAYRLVARPGVKHGIDRLKDIMSARIVELGVEVEKGLHDSNFYETKKEGKKDDKDEKEDAATEDKAKPLTGSARITAAAVKWVDDILQLKDKFDTFLSQCFDDDKILESAFTKAFSDFINMFNRSSEFVSLFIDHNLKSGIKGKTEAEVDETVDKAIILVRYLQDRDMFQRYYQKHLTRRLLGGKTESQEAEKQLISRMKQEIGNHFTSKFEGMFKDMDTSRDLTSGYRDYISNLGSADGKVIDLSINVLTSNNWPAEHMGPRGQDRVRSDCNWPADVKRLQESFLQYYLSERNGRVLTWMGSSGSADIKCVFPKIPGRESGPLSKERRYELNVSTYGMVVLMLFNDLPDGQWLGYEDILAETNIPAAELNRTLASLSIAPKSRVLTKEPMSRTIKSGDKFSYNSSFTSKTVKIRAPIVNSQSKVEDADERKETEKKNDESRAHIVDAAVVRIMKARKALPHNLLLTEVINVLTSRFKPDVSMVKRRIEDLIAREYLERHEDDAAQTIYRYLA